MDFEPRHLRHHTHHRHQDVSQRLHANCKKQQLSTKQAAAIRRMYSPQVKEFKQSYSANYKLWKLFKRLFTNTKTKLIVWYLSIKSTEVSKNWQCKRRKALYGFNGIWKYEIKLYPPQ